MPRSRLPLVALVALALVASACGGADGSQVASLENPNTEAPVAAGDLEATDDTGATTTTAVLDPEEALLAFAACMRDNGVDMADPTVDADGNLRLSRPEGFENSDDGAREAARTAREACAGYLEGVAQGFRNVDRTDLQDDLLAYAQCIRDNGYEDMPDPDVSNFGPGAGGAGGGPFGAIDPEDPDFIAADAACRELFGDLRPGRGPGPGPSGPQG